MSYQLRKLIDGLVEDLHSVAHGIGLGQVYACDLELLKRIIRTAGGEELEVIRGVAAIRDLACEEKELLLLRPFAIILICWHGAKWLLSWGSVDLDGLLEIGGLLIGLINLYFHFQLLTNLAAIASKYQDEGDEMDATLLRCRTFQTVTLTAAMIIRRLTNLFGEYAGFITIGLAILYIIAGIIIIKTLIELKCYLTEDTETT